MPEAAQRDLLKKEEQRKKLGVTMARLDQKILEFTAQAAGEQRPASAAGVAEGSSWRGQAHLAEAAYGAGGARDRQAPVAEAADAARGARCREAAAPMDVEPPAAPRTGKRLSLKLPARLADQPPRAAADRRRRPRPRCR